MNGFEENVNRYGRDVSLHLPDGWTSGVYRAFLQPVSYRGSRYFELIKTDIGSVDRGCYIYIGPSGHDLTMLPDGAWLCDGGGQKYEICRAEKVFVKNSVFYVRALVRSIEEELYE